MKVGRKTQKFIAALVVTGTLFVGTGTASALKVTATSGSPGYITAFATACNSGRQITIGGATVYGAPMSPAGYESAIRVATVWQWNGSAWAAVWTSSPQNVLLTSGGKATFSGISMTASAYSYYTVTYSIKWTDLSNKVLGAKTYWQDVSSDYAGAYRGTGGWCYFSAIRSPSARASQATPVGSPMP